MIILLLGALDELLLVFGAVWNLKVKQTFETRDFCCLILASKHDFAILTFLKAVVFFISKNNNI